MEATQPIKRAAVRSPADTVVACRPYVSHGGAHTADGVMHNYSSQGSYIETTRQFETGTILIVRMVRYTPPKTAGEERPQPRTIGLAEVKWCRKLVDTHACRYGMGLRYLD